MKRNVGKTDRGIRILLGLLIIAAGWYFGSWIGIIGLVPLLTGAVGWCPLYVPFGIFTCRQRAAGQSC